MAQETTYLEISEEAGAHKFYEVVVDNARLTIRFGRIGDAGQAQVKQCASTEQALAEAHKKIAEKLRKGYTHATPGERQKRHPLAPYIARLDTWLRQNRPEHYARLLPGLDDQQLQAFEAVLGLELPGGMREWFRWRNGQELNCYKALVHNFSLMTTQSILEERAGLDGFLKSGEFDQPNWWSYGWVPFLENGGGDYYCLDTVGTFTGNPGQLIHYWHDYEDRSVIAPSFDSWLRTVVTRLEDDDEIEDSPEGYPLDFDAG